MKRVLTIAGSDSGGGAGIQADLKTITVLGAYGMSVVTALTAQNTQRVEGVYEVPADFVGAQLDAVIRDIGVDTAKTGMLSSSGIIEIVSKKVKEHGVEKLVVDPVMVAKSGDPLLRDDAREAMKSLMLPLAYLVTPNVPEAEVLSGIRIKNVEDAKKAALSIHELGAEAVLVKGGHLEEAEDAVDILFDGNDYHFFSAKRIKTENTHGTGCTYSAAIATFLAMGKDLPEAVAEAKRFITSAIRHALDIGQGHGPTNPYSWVAGQAERYQVIVALKEAFEKLQAAGIGRLIPEVQSNLGYALSAASSHDGVAAWPGRIVKFGNSIKAVGCPEFGASRHVANIILTAMRHHPDFRSAMNIRFGDDVLKAAEKAGLTAGSFDRKQEPAAVKSKEGMSLSWGVDTVLKSAKTVPDLIYDRGDVGKEPMVRIIGRDPNDVAGKVIRIAAALEKRVFKL